MSVDIKRFLDLHYALYRVTDLLPLREPLRKMLRENANTLLTYIVEECGEKSAENAEFRIKIGAKIEAMQNTLSASKELGYCHPVNFAVLQREYSEIGRYFEARSEQKLQETIAPNVRGEILNKTVPNMQSLALNKKEDDFVRVFEGGVVSGEEKEEIKIAFQSSTAKQNKNGDPSFNKRQQAIVDFIRERKEVKSTDLATIFSNRFSLKTLQRDLVALIQNKVIEKEGEKRWAVYRMNGYH